MSLREQLLGQQFSFAADPAGEIEEGQVVRARLDETDWSFTQRERPPAIESIHPYPAKFIGDIPRALMSKLPMPPGTLILDPFCGCGTTLMEAQRRSIPSVGVDLNPIACLISRVKTAPTPRLLRETSLLISSAARKNRKPSRWHIPNVDHWFKPSVQGAIAALLHEIGKVEGVVLRNALRLALSSVLVRVSNQESDTRYAAIEKAVGRDDVFDAFGAASDKLDRALSTRDWRLSGARVIEANTLTLSPSAIGGPVGMVITSPPYPNAYEYWLYHKYRMWWLGFDPLAVKEHEIGARAHFFKTRHHTGESFREQMRQTFTLIDRVLVTRGYACFVIGRSKIHGRIVDNADIIQEVAAQSRFGVVARIERVISANRKSFNLAHANIKTETVLILQRGGK